MNNIERIEALIGKRPDARKLSIYDLRVQLYDWHKEAIKYLSTELERAEAKIKELEARCERWKAEAKKYRDANHRNISCGPYILLNEWVESIDKGE